MGTKSNKLCLGDIISKNQEEMINSIAQSVYDNPNFHFNRRDLSWYKNRLVEAIIKYQSNRIYPPVDLNGFDELILQPTVDFLTEKISEAKRIGLMGFPIGIISHLYRDILSSSNSQNYEALQPKLSEEIRDSFEVLENITTGPLDEELVKELKQYLEKYQKKTVLEWPYSQIKEVLPQITKLIKHKDEEAVKLCWPILQHDMIFNSKPVPIAVGITINSIVESIEQEYFDLNILEKNIRKLSKLRENAYKSRKRPIIDLTIGMLLSTDFYGLILSTRGKKYSDLPIIYNGYSITQEILEANVKNLSLLLFHDDFIYNGDMDKKVNFSEVRDSFSPESMVDYLRKSGLVINKETEKGIKIFMEFYINHLLRYVNEGVDFSKSYSSFINLLSILKSDKISEKRKGKPFFEYDFQNNELREVRFPSLDTLLLEAEDLVGEILRKRLVEKAGRKYVEWTSLDKTPENLVYFLGELGKSCENSLRKKVLFYRDLIRKEETFAMTHYTKMNPDKIYFKNIEFLLRDFFAPWASGCCINPIWSILHLAYDYGKSLTQTQIWWNGCQHGILYTLDSFPPSAFSIDSVEVNPSFFSRFDDKFKKKYNALDSLMNGVILFAEQKAQGNFYGINATSNQENIAKWLKTYGENNGKKFVTDIAHVDLPILKLLNFYTVNVGD
ncbi:MAG: hypothetical protein ACTSVB_00630 [Candidatus Heimdallarchaeaceae archaeon]